MSCFTGNYVRLWPQFLPEQPLLYTPVFDARAVCYPNLAVLKDYLAWRQADTHINNQVRPASLAAAAGKHKRYKKEPKAAKMTAVTTAYDLSCKLVVGGTLHATWSYICAAVEAFAVCNTAVV